MSKINGLFEAAKAKTSTSNNTSETMAVQVESYDVSGDVHYVIGRRMDTNEPVKVFLRDLDHDDNRRAVKDYAAKKGMCATLPGGAIRFEGAYKTEDGTYSARWMKQIRFDADSDGSVVYCQTRFSTTANDSYAADLLRIEDAARVTSIEELTEKLASCMTPQGNNYPFAMLQVRSGDDVFCRVMAGSKVKQGDNGYSRTATADVSVAEALKKHAEVIKSLGGVIADPDVEVFIVPGEKIFAGEEYRKSVKPKDLEGFKVKPKESEGQEGEAKYGYVESLVTYKRHPDGTPFLTGVNTIKFAKVAGVEMEALNIAQLLQAKQAKIAEPVAAAPDIAEAEADEEAEAQMASAAQAFRSR